MNKIGIENVENQIINVNKYLYEKLEYLGKKVWTPIENESPIISFIQENPENLAKKLQNMKIKVTGRRAHGGHMRVSVHFYNTIDDIDLLIKNL